MADRVVQILIESSVEGTAEIRQATAATEDLAKAEAKAEEAGGDAGDAFGKVGESAGKMGGVFGLLNPQLGAAVTSIADFADVGEVAAGIADGLGVSLGAVGLGAAALTAVLVLLVVEFNNMNREIELQASLTQTARGANERLTESLRGLQDAQIDAQVAMGALTEAEAEQMRGRLAAQRGIQDLAAAQRDEREELQKIIADTEASRGFWSSMGEDLRNLGTLGVTALTDLDERAQDTFTNWAMGYDETIAAAQARLKILDDEVTQTAQYTKETRLAGEVVTEAAEKSSAADASAAASAAARTEAERELADALKKKEDAQKRATDALMEYLAVSAEGAYSKVTRKDAEALAAFDAALGRVIPSEALTRTQELVLIETDLALALSRNEITMEQYQSRVELLAQAKLKLAQADEEAARAAKLQQVQGGLGALQGGMGGVLNAAGPIGAITNMVIQLVTSVVDEAGNGLIDQIHNMMMEFFNDLSGLGPELADSMIRSVEEGIPALMNGIAGLLEGLLSAESIQKILVGSIEMLPMMIGGIIELLIVRIPEVAAEFVKTILSPETWIEAGKMLVQGMTENFKGSSLFGQDATIMSTALAVLTGEPSSFVGSFDQTTDYVPKTGLALVHEGEKISRGRTPMGGDTYVQMGGGMVLGTADDIARKIAEQLSGRGVTWGARY